MANSPGAIRFVWNGLCTHVLNIHVSKYHLLKGWLLFVSGKVTTLREMAEA